MSKIKLTKKIFKFKRNNDNSYSLDFSKRKDRFLLVLSLTTGFIFLLFKSIPAVTNFVSNQIYLNQNILFGSNFPFGIQHFLSALYFTFLLMTSIFIFIYLFWELFSFSKSSYKLGYVKADESFTNLLIFTFINLIIFPGLISIIVLFFSIPSSGFYKYLFIVSTLLFIIFTVVMIKLNKALISKCNIQMYFFIFILSLSISAIFILAQIASISTNIDLSINDSEGIPLTLTYKSIEPKDIIIKIKGINESTYLSEKTLKLNKDDFLLDSVSITKSILDSTGASYVIADSKGSFDTYSKTLPIQKYLVDGINILELDSISDNKNAVIIKYINFNKQNNAIELVNSKTHISY